MFHVEQWKSAECVMDRVGTNVFHVEQLFAAVTKPRQLVVSRLLEFIAMSVSRGTLHDAIGQARTVRLEVCGSG